MGVDLLSEIQTEFSKHQNSEVAKGQQNYMKSTMPYWGIKTPEKRKFCTPLFKKYAPKSNNEYSLTVKYMFDNATKREEWYASIAFALRFKTFINFKNIDLYLHIVRQSQWWDVVDTVASNLIGPSLRGNSQLDVYLYNWIRDEDMWIRRTALLVQLNYKSETNFDLLSKLILHVADETEFFIRKAIGWVLREHSKTEPNIVEDFINNHNEILSSLSIREGMKVINKLRIK